MDAFRQVPTDPLGGLAGAAERQRLADEFDDTRSWLDPNGRRLSDRLWLARAADRRAIDTILRESLAAGGDPIQTARRLEQYLTPEGRKQTTRTPRGGLGLYAARRLARTETTRAFGQATIQAAERNPFVRGVKWNLSHAHPEPDECDQRARGHSPGMPRGVYGVRDVPQYPGHPNELCYLTPVTLPDAEIDAVLRELQGELGRLPVSDAIDPPRPATGLARVAQQVRGDLDPRPVVQRALQVIDAVHRDGNLPRIPVETFFEAFQGIGGFFEAERNPNTGVEKARRIALNVFKAWSDRADGVFVHEVGHFLDLAGIGSPDREASAIDPLMAGWRAAVDATAAVNTLKLNRIRGYGEAIDPVSGAVSYVPVRAKYIDYLLGYDELWARSYTQYVATKSGDPRLLADIDSRRGDSAAAQATPAQWNDADFAPVLDAIDVLFKGLGWIR